jgi:Flp pilus assembly protein TadD
VKQSRHNRQNLLLAALSACLFTGCGERPREYAGSASCRDCHERFHELWSTSHHGKALQPWSEELAAALPPQDQPIEVEGRFYQAHVTAGRGWVADDEGTEYDIAYAIGGKNLFNFLTLLEDGRLQVLPVLYDVRQALWRHTTHSMLRHFSDGREDAPLAWRDPMLTFNAACFGCHVSQIESNYDPASDTYATTWNEAGISCESCHGPSSEHIRVCREAKGGKPPKDLKLISWNDLTVTQQNDTCSVCHTKGAPITPRFETGGRYWDHYDLVTFEHDDYHPDGRDFGENYTMGSWLLSPCVTRGGLGCIHCHTSSGRYRFKGETANNACLPCHQERVENPAPHIHHPDGGAAECVQCHMPMNPFGGMNQSDHSMRPPMPELSVAGGSRNACIQCHKDQSHHWAAEAIRSWHPGYGARIDVEMRRTLLVKALREGQWDKIPDARAYLADPEADPLFTTSLIRLLPPSDDPVQRDVFRKLLKDSPHPLVRAAAATALDADRHPGDHEALFSALSDDYRLVRIRAAESLAALPQTSIPKSYRAAHDAATREMWQAIELRLDHWSSHFNAANILMRQKRHQEALARYDRAHELRPDIAPPLVNAAMVLAILNRPDEAEQRLHKATKLPEPSAEAHFNLGLLLAERGRTNDARTALRKSLEIEPDNAAAACNLAILIADSDYPEAVRLLEHAIGLEPANPRHVQTLAFYHLRSGRTELAREVLQQAVRRGVSSPEINELIRRLPSR